MARTNLTVQEIELEGLAPSFEAFNADGEMITNDGQTFIEVKNTGDEKTITVVTPLEVSGLAVTDLTVTIPATTGDKMIGPFPRAHFNQQSGDDKGKVYINVSDETAVTIAAFKLS